VIREMQRVRVARDAGKHHDVGIGHGPAVDRAHAELDVFEIEPVHLAAEIRHESDGLVPFLLRFLVRRGLVRGIERRHVRLRTSKPRVLCRGALFALPWFLCIAIYIYEPSFGASTLDASINLELSGWNQGLSESAGRSRGSAEAPWIQTHRAGA